MPQKKVLLSYFDSFSNPNGKISIMKTKVSFVNPYSVHCVTKLFKKSSQFGCTDLMLSSRLLYLED